MSSVPTASTGEYLSINRLLEQGRWKTARTLLEKLCQKYPQDLKLMTCLAKVLQNSPFRAHSESEQWSRRGLCLDPVSPDLLRTLVHSLIYQAKFSEARTLLDRLQNQPDQTYCPDDLRSRLLLSRADPVETAASFIANIRACGSRFTTHFVPNLVAIPPRDAARRRLRVGYYSDELFIVQPMYFLYPLLFHHNRNDFEVYVYSGSPIHDEMTDLYIPCADHWVDLSPCNREERTARIAADDLDILVAASGNSFYEDYAFLLDRPAPIQISWWLSNGTSSTLDCFDYLLIDDISAPPDSDPLFTEKLWRLEGNATPFIPASVMEDVSPSPALRNGFVTFCSTTRMFRLNPDVIATWSEILRRVSGSRLIVDSLELGDASSCTALQKQFVAQGISPDRLDLGRFNQWETFRNSDITLDAFPFSAGTSPCQAMYLGHPVVTLAGIPSHGRLAASHVTWAGHPEWVAQSVDAYIDTAVDLAQNPQKLAQIRQSLRGDLENSPLMDYPDFARRLTAAYQAMLKRYQQGDWHSRT